MPAEVMAASGWVIVSVAGGHCRSRCCAGPDHRDTYDAMFGLWFPAALGAQAVSTTEDESAELRGCRPMMSGYAAAAARICWPTIKTWPAGRGGWWR